MHQNSEPQEVGHDSPSFNTYSTTSLSAEKAAAESADDDFEFTTSPTTLPEQIFPLFNRHLITLSPALNHKIFLDYRNPNDAASADRIPLQKLFLEDADSSSTSSSELEEELDSVPPETYCVWTPRSPLCEKSNSTGTSASGRAVKKWRLRDLMLRSKSDGKESNFVFLKRDKERESKEGVVEKNKSSKSKAKDVSSSGHEMFYLKSKGVNKEAEKRRSYLPYRPEVFGFFGYGYGSGLGRTSLDRSRIKNI